MTNARLCDILWYSFLMLGPGAAGHIVSELSLHGLHRPFSLGLGAMALAWGLSLVAIHGEVRGKW